MYALSKTATAALLQTKFAQSLLIYAHNAFKKKIRRTVMGIDAASLRSNLEGILPTNILLLLNTYCSLFVENTLYFMDQQEFRRFFQDCCAYNNEYKQQ